jgi:predicted extracellular nuclease
LCGEWMNQSPSFRSFEEFRVVIETAIAERVAASFMSTVAKEKAKAEAAATKRAKNKMNRAEQAAKKKMAASQPASLSSSSAPSCTCELKEASETVGGPTSHTPVKQEAGTGAAPQDSAPKHKQVKHLKLVAHQIPKFDCIV